MEHLFILKTLKTHFIYYLKGPHLNCHVHTRESPQIKQMERCYGRSVVVSHPGTGNPQAHGGVSGSGRQRRQHATAASIGAHNVLIRTRNRTHCRRGHNLRTQESASAPARRVRRRSLQLRRRGRTGGVPGAGASEQN